MVTLKDPEFIHTIVEYFLMAEDLTQVVRRRLNGLITQVFEIRAPSTSILDQAFSVATEHSYLNQEVKKQEEPMHLDRLVQIYDAFYSSHMVEEAGQHQEPRSNFIKHRESKGITLTNIHRLSDGES